MIHKAKEKHYLDAQALLEGSFRLAAMIYDSGFRPSFVVAVWRGGAPIGIAVQEYFATHGVPTDHIAIRTKAYEAGIDSQRREIDVQGLEYLADRLTPLDRVLIVDDVYDTGRSIAAIIDTLSKLCRRNMPTDIRIAVPWYKPDRNQTTRSPDYFLWTTDAWLKFPHSLEGLSLDEIREHRPRLWEILGKYLESPR
ncbi:MAG: phosphoribosyltransferase [Pseudomonadales bacterium]